MHHEIRTCLLWPFFCVVSCFHHHFLDFEKTSVWKSRHLANPAKVFLHWKTRKVQIYILSRKVVMMILPLCTRVVRQAQHFFCICPSFSAKVSKKTGPRFKTRGLSNFNFCQQGNTNRFGELNLHLVTTENPCDTSFLVFFKPHGLSYHKWRFQGFSFSVVVFHPMFTTSGPVPSWLQKSFSNRGLEYLKFSRVWG